MGRGVWAVSAHPDRVFTVSLMPDGRRAVSGSDDKTLRVWDVESGQCLGMIALSAPIQTIAIKHPPRPSTPPTSYPNAPTAVTPCASIRLWWIIGKDTDFRFWIGDFGLW